MEEHCSRDSVHMVDVSLPSRNWVLERVLVLVVEGCLQEEDGDN